MPAKNSNAMDALQMILAKANEINTVELDIYGEKIILSYKPLGWRGINKSLSFAMEYGQDGGENNLSGKFYDLMSDKNIRVRLTEAAVDHLAEVGYDRKMGARPLARKINDLIKVPLSKKILFDNLRDCSVIARLEGTDTIVFDSAETVIPHIDSEGFIVVQP